MRVFALQRFVNMARLIREVCQHEKPLANKITEPPAFTVSKQELRGKAIVLVTFSARTLLGGSHQYGKQKQSKLRGKKRKWRSKCRRAIARRHSWMTWNLWGRIILACAWKWLSHNLSFFWQVRSNYFFLLIPTTLSDAVLHCSSPGLSSPICEGWSNHEPLPLSARIFFFSSPNSPLFFFLGPVFAWVLTQGLFSFVKRFKSMKRFRSPQEQQRSSVSKKC